MRAYLLIIFFSFPVLFVQGQKNDTLTLQQCIAMAISNSSELKRFEIMNKRDDIAYRSAHLNRLPSLSAYVGHGFSQGRSVDPTTNQFTERNFVSGNQGIGGEISLFNGFRTLYDIRMQGSARAAGRLEFESKLNDFKLNVLEAYIQVLTATDILEQSKRQWEVTQAQLRRAEVMHREGAFAPGDYYDIKGQSKSDANTVAIHEKAMYNARLRLARLLEIDEREMGRLARLTMEPDLQLADAEVMYAGAQNLPHIQALRHRIEESKHRLYISRANLYPSISMGANLGSHYSDQFPSNYFTQFNQNLGKNISFSLRIPIFNRLQTLQQLKLGRLGIQDAELHRDLQLRLLQEETARAVFNLNNSLSEIRNQEAQVESFAESFRIARVNFEAGVTNSLTFLSAKNKVDAAELQLVLKRYEYILQHYINDYYMGSLGL